MSDQVPPAVKTERVRRLAELETRLREQYFAGLRGRRLEVLVESPAERAGRMLGTSCRYAPVELAGDATAIGGFAEITAGTVSQGRIQAVDDPS